ncbi:antirestriction protein [Pseudoalteromonas phage KB12-38]|nr:antirestriction protein [Pseudoalteromonas phage KB12-38]
MKQTFGQVFNTHPLLETHFYNMADRVSGGDYKGGSWNDSEPSEGVLYAKLNSPQEKIKATNPAAYVETEVSTDAFSIVVNLYFWSDLSFQLTGELKELAIKRFHALRDWAVNEHPDAGDIYQLTD